ncbi:MAG: DNA-binding protein [Gammaproteobacteria bacterium]|nr:MAG: DNA-binding protein [Gammaproteobacteria bacterium]
MDANKQKKQFSDQLKAAMITKGYEAKAAVLEREFNLRYYGKAITIQGAAKWLRGQSIPRADKILTLSKWLEVEPSELVYGVEIKEKIKESKKKWQEAIGYQEKEVFEAFLNLPVPQRKIVREVILAFSLACKE